MNTALQKATQKTARRVAKVVDSPFYQGVQIFILTISGLFVVADIILPMFEVAAPSAMFKEWAFGKGFVLAWIWGVLAGHLFMTRGKEERLLDEVLAICILIILSLLLLIVACFLDKDGHTWLNLILLAAGTGAGHYLWPQTPV